MTPFQLDASAKAPCTSTIVGLTSVCWDPGLWHSPGTSCSVVMRAHVVPAGDDVGTHRVTASRSDAGSARPASRPRVFHERTVLLLPPYAPHPMGFKLRQSQDTRRPQARGMIAACRGNDRMPDRPAT